MEVVLYASELMNSKFSLRDNGRVQALRIDTDDKTLAVSLPKNRTAHVLFHYRYPECANEKWVVVEVLNEGLNEEATEKPLKIYFPPAFEPVAYAVLRLILNEVEGPVEVKGGEMKVGSGDIQ